MSTRGKQGPLHRQIAESIRQEILKGTFVEGAQLPTEVELVKRFSASRPTVGQALRQLQFEGLIERRAGAGTFVRRATGDTSRQGGLWGLIIPGLGNTEIFEPICAEIALQARQHGANLLWSADARQNLTPVDQAMDLCQQCLRAKVDGVFFAPLELTEHKDDVNRRIVDSLKGAGIPVVLLDRDLYPAPKRSGFDLVSMDNFSAGLLVTAHLLAQGARNPRFIAPAGSAFSVYLRIAGFREALAQHGLAAQKRHGCVGDAEDTGFVVGLVKQADAVVCANDHTAALLMRSLEKLNVRVPRDLRLAGFDDTKYATLLSVPLTTVHQPCREIGRVAALTMLERVKNPNLPPRQIFLSGELVVRESCGGKTGR
jgi:GntR family transcriptional regulator of arabinose operon